MDQTTDEETPLRITTYAQLCALRDRARAIAKDRRDFPHLATLMPEERAVFAALGAFWAHVRTTAKLFTHGLNGERAPLVDGRGFPAPPRYLYLALGFLLGRRYRQLEPRRAFQWVRVNGHRLLADRFSVPVASLEPRELGSEPPWVLRTGGDAFEHHEPSYVYLGELLVTWFGITDATGARCQSDLAGWLAEPCAEVGPLTRATELRMIENALQVAAGPTIALRVRKNNPRRGGFYTVAGAEAAALIATLPALGSALANQRSCFPIPRDGTVALVPSSRGDGLPGEGLRLKVTFSEAHVLLTTLTHEPRLHAEPAQAVPAE